MTIGNKRTGRVKVCDPKKTKGLRNHRNRVKAKQQAEENQKRRDEMERKKAKMYEGQKDYSNIAREYSNPRNYSR